MPTLARIKMRLVYVMNVNTEQMFFTDVSG